MPPDQIKCPGCGRSRPGTDAPCAACGAASPISGDSRAGNVLFLAVFLGLLALFLLKLAGLLG